jgi:hypothetical protein
MAAGIKFLVAYHIGKYGSVSQMNKLDDAKKMKQLQLEQNLTYRS